MDGVIAWTDAEAQKKKVGADVRGDAVSGMKGPEDSEDAARRQRDSTLFWSKMAQFLTGLTRSFLNLDHTSTAQAPDAVDMVQHATKLIQRSE